VPGKQAQMINLNSYATSKAIQVTGLNQFTFTPTNTLPINQVTTTRIIIIGNETGGRAEVDITLSPKVIVNG